jgi:two-component system, OmpR family, sensor histidine kinase MtrB
VTLVTFAALALAGLCSIAGLAALARLRRQLRLVERAEHELRGPATALGLACERMRRERAGARHAAMLRVQLDRLDAGLADLTAARTGRASVARAEPSELRAVARAALAPWDTSPGRVAFGWLGGPAPARVDRRALAKALGNLVANAAEHGEGQIRVRGRTTPSGVRIEIRNRNRRTVRAPLRPPRSIPPRGRGLRIAERAARQLGGRVLVDLGGAETVAVLELPRAAGGERDGSKRNGGGEDVAA